MSMLWNCEIELFLPRHKMLDWRGWLAFAWQCLGPRHPAFAGQKKVSTPSSHLRSSCCSTWRRRRHNLTDILDFFRVATHSKLTTLLKKNITAHIVFASHFAKAFFWQHAVFQFLGFLSPSRYLAQPFKKEKETLAILITTIYEKWAHKNVCRS